MFVEMTRGSQGAQAALRKGFESSCCAGIRRQKPRCEKPVCLSEKRSKVPPKPACSLRSYLTFCLKGQKKMEQREGLMESQAEGSEGKLRELTTKWFIDTQLPLIVHDGFFPKWFLGFITRKDAEQILCEKELGCFLIRLSDKAIAYILSYRGRDRCRHFVINQSESGKFLVCGDTTGHDTLSELIHYYKTKPIEPFGEHLTSSCVELPNEELYDIIQEKPLDTIRAATNQQNQENAALKPSATGLPRSNRPRGAPPVPPRSRQVECSLRKDQERLLYAQLSKQASRETQRLHPCQDSLTGHDPGTSDRSTTQPQSARRFSPLCRPVSIYSDLGQDGRSRSLPLLDSSSDRQQPHCPSTPAHTPPRRSPWPVRQPALCDATPEAALCRVSSSGSGLEQASGAALYQLAGSPGPCETRLQWQEDVVYTEVPDKSNALSHGARSDLGMNTYEPVEDFRPRQKQTSWGLKNDKWKWPFPEVKRKW